MFTVERATIEQQRMARAANTAGELVHDPAQDPRIAVLDELAEFDHVDARHLEAEHVLQRKSRRDFERR